MTRTRCIHQLVYLEKPVDEFPKKGKPFRYKCVLCTKYFKTKQYWPDGVQPPPRVT